MSNPTADMQPPLPRPETVAEALRRMMPPLGDDQRRSAHMPWVSVARGAITVEQPTEGPPITPDEVQRLLDVYVVMRTLPAALVTKGADALRRRGDALTLEEFQDGCWSTATYPRAGQCLLYTLIGWVDELGEVLEVAAATFTGGELDNTKLLHTSLLTLVAQVGKAAGLIKKAYRNVDPEQGVSGVLSAAALGSLRRTLADASDSLDYLRESAEYWSSERDRVELPPVELTPEQKAKFGRESGDALWYPMTALTELGLSADAIAKDLLAKLRQRAAAGTLRSTGDDESTRAPGAD